MNKEPQDLAKRLRPDLAGSPAGGIDQLIMQRIAFL